MNGIHEVRGSIPLSSTINTMNWVKGVCKAMRLARLRSFLVLIFTAAITGAIAGCDNPFDPLKSSDKIQGLTYFDFAASQEHWDSDPEWDGLQITMNYYNEFGDTLSFHDKSHKIVIEFWSEDADAKPVSLLTSKTVAFSNSDDFIRIPIEYYGGLLGIVDPTIPITGCLRVTVFPPQAYPKKELVAPMRCGQEFFNAEDVVSPP